MTATDHAALVGRLRAIAEAALAAPAGDVAKRMAEMKDAAREGGGNG